MSATATLVEQVRQFAAARTEKHERDYWKLVRDCAAGKEVDPAWVDAFILEVGRNYEQFDADIEKAEDRIQWRALVAAIPRITAEREALQGKLTELDEELARLTAEIEARRAPIYARWAEATRKLGEAGDAEQNLFRDCPRREFATRSAELTKHYEALCQEEKEVRRRIAEYQPYLNAEAFSENGDHREPIAQAKRRTPELKKELGAILARKDEVTAEMERVRFEAAAV
ncbi:MAG: hypothetical protein C0467_15865 [Planctomycetaceae bacterium]|nr:hypothetical protein [Planctomycetaceae bacterium]